MWKCCKPSRNSSTPPLKDNAFFSLYPVAFTTLPALPIRSFIFGRVCMYFSTFAEFHIMPIQQPLFQSEAAVSEFYRTFLSLVRSLSPFLFLFVRSQ